MPEPILPLPTDHVFVLKLEEREGRRHYDKAAAKFDDAALILD